MAAAVRADPYDRWEAVAFGWSPTSNVVVVLLVTHDVTLLRDAADADVDDDDDDDDEARMALIPNDSVADDVT